MRHVFIGTEQDLIDNGFEKVENVADSKLKFIRKDEFGYITISLDDSLFYFSRKSINDLLEKGLVVEV